MGPWLLDSPHVPELVRRTSSRTKTGLLSARTLARRPIGASILAATLSLGALGCSRWKGGELYVPPGQPAWKKARKQAAFRVGLPGPGWEAHRDEGTQVAWHNERTASMIQVRSQCDEHGDSDLQSFTDHLRIDTDEWQIVQERYFRLVGRQALRTTVKFKLDGLPVHAELVVLKKNGCLFDLSLLSKPNGFDASMPAFEAVVAGFDFPVRR